jgi:CRP-like cAMP-binding protein
MSMDSEQKQLVEFFQSTGKMNAVTAKEIAGYFAQRLLQKNELFLKQGQVSNEYMFLESGLIRAFSHSLEGDEVTTAFYSPGYAVFEVASFFNRTPSREYLQALSPVKGWIISFEQLNFLFHSLPEFREFGRSILVKGFAGLKEKMLAMITATAEERYAALLQTNPEIFLQAPLKYIASYLGITDSSLSRIRKEMMHKA